MHMLSMHSVNSHAIDHSEVIEVERHPVVASEVTAVHTQHRTQAFALIIIAIEFLGHDFATSDRAYDSV